MKRPGAESSDSGDRLRAGPAPVDHGGQQQRRSVAADPHDRWMQSALELAARGRCGASPNPMVGAVVLDPSGRRAGVGYHARFGGEHAEIAALAEAGERARGGTLYVTLEPCSHHGKTPPCTDAILAAGIAKVVFAMADPSPAAGGGADRLRAEGLEVVEGPGSDSARILNRRWLRWARFHRPWVTVKAAVSMDGKIATRNGESKWITGEAARSRGLELREEHDAILVGVDTVLADDPRLTRRLGLNPVSGWKRVILDSNLRTPSSARVVTEEPSSTVIVHTAAASADQRQRLRKCGVELVELRAGDDGRIDLDALLDHLARREVVALLVEGGPTVHGSFHDADLIDEVALFVAPVIIGGPAPSAIAGLGVPGLDVVRRFHFEAVSRHAPDLEIRAVRTEDADVHGSD